MWIGILILFLVLSILWIWILEEIKNAPYFDEERGVFTPKEKQELDNYYNRKSKESSYIIVQWSLFGLAILFVGLLIWKWLF